MLDSFRKASQSWFIKILFGMLILSFSVWGIGDVIRMRAESTPAIVVGSQEIPAGEVAEEFRRDTEQLAQAFGGKLSPDQARQLGLLQRPSSSWSAAPCSTRRPNSSSWASTTRPCAG